MAEDWRYEVGIEYWPGGRFGGCVESHGRTYRWFVPARQRGPEGAGVMISGLEPTQEKAMAAVELMHRIEHGG